MFHARKDRNKWRVWLSNWANDQFEVLTEEEFQLLDEQLERFGGIQIHEDD